MSVARTWSVALSGIDGALVEVEADLSNRTPEFRIIGLPDKALAEAAQRVHNACQNAGSALPKRRLTVNLSPASLPKHGSGFDVAIAVAALATAGGIDPVSVSTTVHLGELGLDGRLRPVIGVLPAVVVASRAGMRRVVVPAANADEARLVEGIEVVGAAHLVEVLRCHGAELDDPHVEAVAAPPSATDDREPGDLSEVIGQAEAVEALLVAAAGGHHLLMSGPPGAGKTMLARRLPGILPPLDDRDALVAASLRSLSGERVDGLTREPPFEAPHHSASAAALIGGGSRVIRPGAIARASGGILFLDEAAEFSGHVLDTLRQPIERGEITIHRATATATFPARFQLVLATNPCPCGNYGVRGAECTCPSLAIRRYRGRLTGPLLDRIDIELGMVRVSSAHGGQAATTSTDARARIVEARRRARLRLAATPWRSNAEPSGAWLRQGPSAPTPSVRRPLDEALERGALTLRGYDRVLRVAWSIADLQGDSHLALPHIGRALFLRRGVRR